MKPGFTAPFANDLNHWAKAFQTAQTVDSHANARAGGYDQYSFFQELFFFSLHAIIFLNLA